MVDVYLNYKYFTYNSNEVIHWLNTFLIMIFNRIMILVSEFLIGTQSQPINMIWLFFVQQTSNFLRFFMLVFKLVYLRISCLFSKNSSNIFAVKIILLKKQYVEFYEYLNQVFLPIIEWNEFLSWWKPDIDEAAILI